MNEAGKKLLRFLEAEDPEIDFRIKTGIETNRKGFAFIELLDGNKQRISKARIGVRQLTHEFLFGGNAFMVEQFSTEAENRLYEQRFAAVFNEAVVPFYWSDLEPEDGVSRFARGSKPIYRRPPPDTVLDFCREHHIRPKGHPLCWHSFSPEWAPKDPQLLMARYARRIREIAERYGDTITLWDVVNEAQTRSPLTRTNLPAMPDDHVEQAFRLAERYLPSSALLYNDDNRWWNHQGNYSPVYLLVRHLLDRGCRVDGLGLQYHMFDWLLPETDQFMNPRHLFACLDLYAKLQIPLNISEISLQGGARWGDGEKFQAIAAEKLYRLWFSHPAMNSIVWWNLVDGTAAVSEPGVGVDENALCAGLLHRDLSPKPAFEAINKLINREWRTNLSLDYQDGAANAFHGFYGDYELEIQTESGSWKKYLTLGKNHRNTFTIQL